VRGAYSAAGRQEASKLPGCDLPISVDAMKTGLVARGNIVVSYDHIAEDAGYPLGGTAHDPERRCRVHVVASAGDGELYYTLRWSDVRHDRISVMYSLTAPGE
jgi:hypothetical protein